MKLVSLLSSAAIFLATQASAININDVDFSQKQSEQGLIYAPLKGTTNNYGVFWYTHYSQDVSPASNINSVIRKISVRAMPTSYSDGSYTRFVQQQGAIDQRQSLLPSDAVICEANTVLTDKLTELGFNYQLDKRVGGYPGLCWLNITYMKPANPSAETTLINFMKNNKVIDHYFSIGGQASPAVYLDAQSIVTRLIDSGALVHVPQNDVDTAQYYAGDLYRIAFETAKMESSLFRSDNDSNEALAFEDWKAFLDLFSIKLNGKASVPQQLADQQIELEAGSSGNTEVTVDTRN